WATAAALVLGVDAKEIQRGLWSFPGLAHRMEDVGRKGGVLFVNDSKATNADAASRALACFNDVFWIAGGKPKTGGIVSLAEFFPRMRKAYLIADAAHAFATTLDGQRRHGARRGSVAGPRGGPVRPLGPRRGPGCRRPWCRFRPPAPRSTSIPTSRCGATSSANWCGRSPASHDRAWHRGPQRPINVVV